MTDEASPEAAGDAAGRPVAPARAMPAFTIRKVPPPTAEQLRVRREAMERAIRFGAAPYRDAEGKARYVFFKEANNAPVEAWRRDREAKRGFRRTQQARKAAGQLIWHPEDQIELAKRLGVIHYREGRSTEGAAERGLYDAIWRYEHVWDSFTVPRRFGRDTLETGRIAAVAEEEARKLQAEDPRAVGGFWVRDRKNNGLIYVVPNPDSARSEGASSRVGKTRMSSSARPTPLLSLRRLLQKSQTNSWRRMRSPMGNRRGRRSCTIRTSHCRPWSRPGKCRKVQQPMTMSVRSST